MIQAAYIDTCTIRGMLLQHNLSTNIARKEYRRRMNHELYQLYASIDIVKRIKMARLRWLGHVSRMEENEPARKIFEDVLEGKRKIGRPRLRWKD